MRSVAAAGVRSGVLMGKKNLAQRAGRSQRKARKRRGLSHEGREGNEGFLGRFKGAALFRARKSGCRRIGVICRSWTEL